MSLKSNLFPPQTPQKSYMQCFLALIVAALLFFSMGALTKNNPNMGTGTAALVGVAGLIIVVAYFYAVIKHIQAIIRVFRLPRSSGKLAWMILSTVGGIVFITLMLYFMWMVMFIVGFVLDKLAG
ncbi:MAG: hypothetical protein ACOCZ8_01045 [Bacteroidota bacterium]